MPSLKTTALAISTMTRDKWSEILGGDPLQAVQWLEAAAALDVTEAQATLGQWCIQGHGTPINHDAAFKWFTRAAQDTHPMAMNMLGRCYEHGWGTAPDVNEAAHWYARAAQKGLDWGMYNFANLLATGRGIGQDHAQALMWYQRAAALDHARSMNMVGRYLENGLTVEKDPVAAQTYYRKSAEAGDFRGQFSYATILVEAGRIDESLQWFARIPQTATPAFMQRVIESLEGAAIPSLRALARQMRTPAATHT